MLVDGWVDIHAHFYPPESQDVREQRLRDLRASCWCTKEPPEWEVESILAYMERTGIAMQMLSNIPKALSDLRVSNDYGASLVTAYPDRFGLLAAIPTDHLDNALEELMRVERRCDPDGFAVTCDYNGVLLSDALLEPLWAALNMRRAVVFVHPNAYAPPSLDRPCVIVEVAFETTRTIVDMLYRGVFRRYPDIRFVVAHCGGALPALSGRLALIGLEQWVPNPEQITSAELSVHLSRLYVDTAATMPTALAPALTMTGLNHIVYGSDCGVPCSTNASMNANIEALREGTGLTSEQVDFIGRNALSLFPKAAARLNRGHAG